MPSKGSETLSETKVSNRNINRRHVQGKKHIADPESRALWQLIGRKIRFYRNAREMTAADLAQAVGLSRVSVTNAEAGVQRLYIDSMLKMASVLRVPIADLLPGPDGETAASTSEDLKTASPERLRELEAATAQLPVSALRARKTRQK